MDIKLHPMELDFKDEWLNSLINYKNTNVIMSKNQILKSNFSYKDKIFSLQHSRFFS